MWLTMFFILSLVSAAYFLTDSEWMGIEGSNWVWGVLLIANVLIFIQEALDEEGRK